MHRRQALALTLSAVAGAATARPVRREIDGQGFQTIGGIDQWISLRGRRASNPAVLFLHGGPAEAQSPFLNLFDAWEDAFTVVQWDQRGAGRTYGRNGPSTPDVTLDRIVADAIEVADYARRRLGKRAVILVGHSWGALVGVHALRQAPDRFSAFVGTGQVVSWPRTVAGEYAYALQRATAEPNPAALAELRAMGDPASFDFGRTMAVRRWLNHYLPASDQAYLDLQRKFVGDPPPKAGPAADWVAGAQFSIPKLLPALGYDMPRPFFVIQGRDDHITPTDVALDYESKIQAPAKGASVIDGGHFAVFTNPHGFVAALKAKVRPLAV